jgi:hypothetical protein
MSHITKEIDELLTQMESIVEQDEISYEDDEKLQDLYIEVKDQFEFLKGYPINTPQGELIHREIKLLQKRFYDVCQEFESSDDIRDSTLDMMFPDEESMEGYDYDKE